MRDTAHRSTTDVKEKSFCVARFLVTVLEQAEGWLCLGPFVK